MNTRRTAVIGLLAVVALVASLVLITTATPSTSETVTATAPPATSSTTTTTDPGPTPAEVKYLADARQLLLINDWVTTTENSQAWYAEAARQAQAAEAARRDAADAAAERRAAPPDTPAAESVGSNGRCGGDLPPCWVMMRESGGNIRARNPSSSASGKWQFIASTWAGFGGYSEAYLAPESVQDAKARILWAGGAGCAHWSAC